MKRLKYRNCRKPPQYIIWLYYLTYTLQYVPVCNAENLHSQRTVFNCKSPNELKFISEIAQWYDMISKIYLSSPIHMATRPQGPEGGISMESQGKQQKHLLFGTLLEVNKTDMPRRRFQF